MPSTDFFETTVLPAELEAILERRKALHLNGDPPWPPGVEKTATGSEDASPEERVEECTRTHRRAHEARPLGLSFSGGGIRSATLNLGILQGLAEVGLLPFVDYLSTVSGGGYIGSWLHGVIRTQCGGDPRIAAKTLSPTSNPLPQSPDRDPISFLRKYSNYLAPSPSLLSADTWVIGSIWIRNVLLNQLSLLPALAAVVMLLLLIGAISQLGVLEATVSLTALAGALIALGGAVLIMALNLKGIVAQTLQPESRAGTESDRVSLAEHWSWLTVPLVFAASICLAYTNVNGITLWLPGRPLALIGSSGWPEGLLVGGLGLLFWLFQRAGGFYQCYEAMHCSATRAYLHGLWMVPSAAFVSYGLIVMIWQWVYIPGDPWQKIGFAPPLICVALMTGTGLLIGLMGTDYPDAAREWIARMGSLIGQLCAGWAGLYVLAVFAPKGVAWLLANYGKTGLTLIGAWAASTATGVIGGRSARTDGTEKEPSIFARILPLTPLIFMIGYLIAISFAVHMALPPISQERKSALLERYAQDGEQAAPSPQYQVEVRKVPDNAGFNLAVTDRSNATAPTGVFKSLARIASEYDPLVDFGPVEVAKPDGQVQRAADTDRILRLLAYFGGCVLITAICAWRININEFSMHHFYKNRLVRCYLGASNNKKRRPNPFTGFDPQDDFPLSWLLPASKQDAKSSKPVDYRGPFPIVNTALNLNAGSELAKQERKATAFAFTPLYCGFKSDGSKEDEYLLDPKREGEAASGREAVGNLQDTFQSEGYCQTVGPRFGYAYPNGPHLGTVTAISGAAASPNMGFHTSGPMAFLLTVFDARLGWWLGNPRWTKSRTKPGPRFALKYLFAELFGITSGRTRFVNLSDGGHFDNLGLYELVRRRCRYIIIGDGEQDGDLTFGSLGQAIRMCRADFGVEIEINPDPIRIAGKFSGKHCVVGRIRYPENETGFSAGFAGGREGPPEGEARGWLLYLKSSLTGDEPADVIEYHSRFSEFPHQSTADQFFTESQFESYRRLGLHIVRDTFQDVEIPAYADPEAPAPNEAELIEPRHLYATFQQLTRRWYAPLVVSDAAASRLADAYSALIKTYAASSKLGSLTAAVAPKTVVHGTHEFGQEAFGFGLQLIQLMENVYAEFQLHQAANRANPRNAGWMGVFERWCRDEVLYERVWQNAKDDYNPLFAKFVADLHDGVPYQDDRQP